MKRLVLEQSGDCAVAWPCAARVPVVAEFDLPADAYAPPAFASGGAWIATDGGHLVRIDADTNESTLVSEGDDQGGTTVVSAFDSIWVPARDERARPDGSAHE